MGVGGLVGVGGYLVRAVSGLDKCMVRKGSSAPASNGRLKPGRALQCTPMHQEQPYNALQCTKNSTTNASAAQMHR